MTGSSCRLALSARRKLSDLAGATFMVNGRAFSGTGVGYNPLATTGQPRLSALQLFQVDTNGNNIGAEIALLPNSVYLNFAEIAAVNPRYPTPITEPFLTAGKVDELTASTPQPFAWINSPSAAKANWPYQSFVGPGGANEGYDAVDFQNMALALQTVTPRAQGRVVTTNGTFSIEDYLLSLTGSGTATGNFLRFDLEDVPMPSFHRPDLVNFWYHRLFTLLRGNPYLLDPDLAVKAIVQPYDANGNPSPWLPAGAQGQQIAALIAAIKRQAILRPSHDDNPHFDGSNPPSAPDMSNFTTNLSSPKKTDIAYPCWETVGPWDVDNDNDGVRDSNWVDIGDPIQETEDGRRYKTLYAFLCIDLDSRLNVNAHGMVDDLVPPLLDTTKANFFDPTAGSPGNLAHDPTQPSATYSTLQLARGLGYGPADISLRPVFPAPLDPGPSFTPKYGNRSETGGPVDGYAAVLTGRLSADGKEINGRYGFDTNINPNAKTQAATAGMNYHYDPIVQAKEPATSPRWYTGEQATPNLAAQMKFFDYPWAFVDSVAFQRNYQSAFGTPPDLKGRYALGLDYTGQPVYENATRWDSSINPVKFWGDWNPNAIPTTLVTVNGQKVPNGLPFNLLANTPYELDLSSPQRRDNWAASYPDSQTAFNSSIDRTYGGGQRGLNDDAPFSATDLEKVLRGWDTDAGTLPSRLWDVANDFDPGKLMAFDPNRVAYATTQEFGITNPKATDPQYLATAQQIAGINRHLVTTESYSLPVASQTMPGYVSDFGTDGAPGRRNDPAHSGLNYVESTSLPVDKTRYTDDFQVIMAARDSVPISQGITRAQAKITDLLYYRAWLEARRFVMRTQGLTEMGVGGIDPDSAGNGGLSWADYQTFMALVKARTDAVFPRMGDLLAPEVLAGKRMDLNRPFGDGKDNNGDGVVDDPLEAGEPFLDINGNGKRDDGTNGTPVEPFIDINGDGKYQGPGDKLWSDLTTNGTLAEPIEFDYTNGHGEPIHDFIAGLMKKTILGGVRNLESQGRQLFARHLYCLMLLLVDENYIAPWDENDPQLLTWITTERAKLTSASPAISVPEADLIVRRKLTCRMIAQWAVNVVDARDADAIMTPFEYDENPWDGWGVWDDKWIGENSNASFIKKKGDPFNKTNPATFIPLDGDPATNENDAWVIDWSVVPIPNGGPKTLKQLGADPTKAVDLTTTPPNPPMITHPLDQTRGVVWGAERPELLISETLAYHDRRTEDKESADKDGHGNFRDSTSSSTVATTYYKDIDLDQSLRPRGSLFVELQNPWSADGQYPIEIYSQLKRDPNKVVPATTVPSNGVETGRLSTFGIDSSGNLSILIDPPTAPLATVKRSPVWRMIIVEEDPAYRSWEYKTQSDFANPPNGDPTLRLPSTLATPASPRDEYPGGWSIPLTGVATIDTANTAIAKAIYEAAAKAVKAWRPTSAQPMPVFRPANPDFTEAFDPNSKPEQPLGKGNSFILKYPYVEREFYFTTDNSQTTDVTIDKGVFGVPMPIANPNFKLRIPDRSFAPDDATYPSSHLKQDATPSYVPWQTQRFIPGNYTNSIRISDVSIAPILPGRYGVVGTEGVQYKDPAFPDDSPRDWRTIKLPLTSPTITVPRYINMIGRPVSGSDPNTPDGMLNPLKTRRIEMWPCSDPNINQIYVGSNGGYDPTPNAALPPTPAPPATLKSKAFLQTEIGRSNEIVYDAAYNNPNDTNNHLQNVYEQTKDDPLKAYQPCVAIPVEGMSASEPPWGWSPREYEAAEIERNRKIAAHGGSPIPIIFGWSTAEAMGEGRYFGAASGAPGIAGSPPQSYDVPFDSAPELVRTGTTANYRTVHLQRLANPLLPWNPPPGQMYDAGDPPKYKWANNVQVSNPKWTLVEHAKHDLHQPNLPVNPYLTVDTASIDLTAFNGVSNAEGSYPDIGTQNGKQKQKKLGQFRPWAPKEEYPALVSSGNDIKQTMDEGTQIWQFKSLERGAYSQLSTTHLINAYPPGGTITPNPSIGLTSPLTQRLNLAPEGVIGWMGDLNQIAAANFTTGLVPFKGIRDGRIQTMKAIDVSKPVRDSQGMPPRPIPGQQDQPENQVDMVLEHSLGFGNESFGRLYMQPKPGKVNNDYSPTLPSGVALAAGAPRILFPRFDL